MISRANDTGDNNARPAWLLHVFAKPDVAFGLQVGGSVYFDRITSTGRPEFSERIVAGYAARHGISVSGSEIDQALAQAEAQSGGKARFDQLLRSRHLSLADVRDNVRSSLLEQKVRAAVVGPTSSDQATAQQQDQAFTSWLARQLKSSDISVNPRFGRFDPAQDLICPIDSTADVASCPAA